MRVTTSPWPHPPPGSWGPLPATPLPLQHFLLSLVARKTLPHSLLSPAEREAPVTGRTGILHLRKVSGRLLFCNITSSAVQTSLTPTGRPGPPSNVEEGDGEEVRRCRAALQALELREKRLMTEVADLRTELRASSCGVQPSPSPHPVSHTPLVSTSLSLLSCPGSSCG